MKKTFYRLISMALAAVSVSVSAMGGDVMANDGKMMYQDVAEAHWAFGYISKAHEMGLVIDAEESKLEPDKHMTRAELLQMITANFKLPAEYASDTAFGGTVIIMPGFGVPQAPITREEASSLLARAAAYLGIMMTMEYIDYNGIYEDFNQVDPSYAISMQTVCRLGIIIGTSKNTLSPQEPVTCAQAIVMLVRLKDIAG